MIHGSSFTNRFLIIACVATILLFASGCTSPTPNVGESTELKPAPLTGVHAELLADVSRVSPGDTFRIGALLTIPAGSHIYWKNPGASGLPTWVEWTLAEGVEAGDLQWPVPKRFEVEGWDEVSFGYESEVLLYMEVHAPESMVDTHPLSITANVYWLNCEEDGQCIPGKTELQIEIPVGVESERSHHASTFALYQQRVPIRSDAGTVPLFIEWEEGASFTVRPHASARIDFDGEGGIPDFFPDEGEAWTFERVSGAEAGDPEAFRFIPPDDGAVLRGVLKAAVHREDNETRQVFYLLLGE